MAGDVRIVNHMATSEPDAIRVRGFDLCMELIGHCNFGDMAFLEVSGRLPNDAESRLFNAMLVTLVEHGVTATSIVTRLLYMSAPEALQGAIAGGLLGAGSVFLGVVDATARMLEEIFVRIDAGENETRVVRATITVYRDRHERVPGLGHFIHRPEDPRTTRLFQIASETGFAGKYVRMMQMVRDEAVRQYGRGFPINADGAVAALVKELGFDSRVARGFAIMSRAVGLVGHAFDEMETPTARAMWDLVERHTDYRDPE